MKLIERLENIHKCTCGRTGCDYFAPREGEWGTSYSEKEIKEVLEKSRVKGDKELVGLLECVLNKN